MLKPRKLLQQQIALVIEMLMAANRRAEPIGGNRAVAAGGSARPRD